MLFLDICYEKLRNLVPAQKQVAINRGEKVLEVTQHMGLSFEPVMNHWVASNPVIAHLANYYYTVFHLPMTAGVLIWIFWKHPRLYRSIRSALVITTAIALVSFYVLPMAPPRLLPSGQFVDVSHLYPTWGSWSSPTVAEHSNQYAAMPSLHVAWALWCGLVVFNVAKTKWVRIAGLIYPLLTFLVVVGTANHFAIDAVAGGLVITISFGVVWALYGHSAFQSALTREELTLTSTPPRVGVRTAASQFVRR
ncbi:phosphatase PAP2 family protein [Calidifontibacter sp. DB0510]|uniref:Phosphatase PAP2 family protein n=1 Tax=Metallococcus carri TaxID=1656884 RepID=A0A967B2I3_9MICO|nr:phosphatase PAP2 family protein [Metallococcus carri]NHN56784.1 phosphatase PAP2 family protein [Metallococcus carri]NOP37839.1 phosphatase PAP2 family protein [Calidifontibacter sp. DB2511S]